MKKIIPALTVAFASASILAACGSNTDSSTSDDKKTEIYTSTFATAAIAREIGGNQVNVKMIVPPGADPHSYEPTSKQLTEIAKGDLFLLTGTTLEPYSKKIQESLKGTDVRFIETSKDVTLLESDATLHAHEEEGHTEDEQAHEEEGHDHGKYDPHVWLDPVNAKAMARSITVALSKEVPKDKATFEKNLKAFDQQADALDKEFKQAVADGSKKELLVTHAAYGYLAERYGFTQLPIAGISPSDEPSQKQLAALVKEARMHDLKYVAFEETVSPKVARVIQKEIGAKSVTIHNLESVTKSQQNSSYFKLMEENVQTLEQALQ
ncbi:MULTISPECIES: metal ABC transporter solute-binding protein, Zn/Mn family [unclassified Exiguobacterium]|uniref:metal ABC transporter solute-binding protein, Zn/Mn family n=1 Tax=unclassified Exiguobacterium TaxID=2644629 RepID=UPI000E9FF727|nr:MULTISPECIES: zinc ABC transporter substrate-binding protein [unclassified Exiguobacterium]MDT0173177.1 zinc ABC transporter substrate-binding protein [Exiguobacterium sp. BRG2]HAL01477.1 ABC transporter substrate-binding protein [Exiguobacterium sp.]HBF59423.1 ABC transporter substrate-binding protein [Exiguobacterium sp.]